MGVVAIADDEDEERARTDFYFNGEAPDLDEDVAAEAEKAVVDAVRLMTAPDRPLLALAHQMFSSASPPPGAPDYRRTVDVEVPEPEGVEESGSDNSVVSLTLFFPSFSCLALGNRVMRRLLS